ncbi:hypothetical protein MIDIC_460029 [Alphaproteobacteria bacterium]
MYNNLVFYEYMQYLRQKYKIEVKSLSLLKPSFVHSTPLFTILTR